MNDELPLSVFFRSKQRPPPFFRLVTFNFDEGISGTVAKEAINALWITLAALQGGIVTDLDEIRRPGEPLIRVDDGNLYFKIGYSARLWNSTVHAPAIARDRPYEMPVLEKNGPFTKLKWAAGAAPDAGQTDFMFALHADSELAVARAVVEMEKTIADDKLPVRMVCFFSGLHRDDGRSWIDFHDGVNNMQSGEERRIALQIEQGEQDWLIGGTKMAFMKIAVDLAGWRKLSRSQQEVMVGRDKLTGCPIIDATSNGNDLFITLDPAGPKDRPIELGNPEDADLLSASTPASGLALVSHIHRANRSRMAPDQDAARRIYRQGYEFVDSPAGGGVRVGLNFVSFQRAFESISSILGLANWMGDANFGGPVGGTPAIPDFELMRVVSGGYFVIPPMRDLPFPGASIFVE